MELTACLAVSTTEPCPLLPSPRLTHRPLESLCGRKCSGQTLESGQVGRPQGGKGAKKKMGLRMCTVLRPLAWLLRPSSELHPDLVCGHLSWWSQVSHVLKEQRAFSLSCSLTCQHPLHGVYLLGSFDPKRAVQQLRACGVLETIRISAAGYPSR